MTNYLTSVGVQQVSITVAVNTTSNTATITGTGSGAFIIPQGDTSQDTGNLDDTLSRAELTNATTVTAYIGVANATKTITLNAVVIDGDTTNLVKTVQKGTISFSTAQATNTASISAVTNTNTVVHFLGETTGSSTSLSAGGRAIVSLATTTVTATKEFNGTADTIGFQVTEFQGAALNSSTQNVAYNAVKNAASDTTTITSVTTGNTWLANGGTYGNSASNESTTFAYGQLTNATTLTWTWNTSGNLQRNFNVVVAEFIAAVLNQSVQRGTIALAAASSNTATITSSSTSSTFCNWLNNSSSATTLNLETSLFKVTQTNTTTITLTADTTATGTGSYEAVEIVAFVSASTSGFNHYYSRFIGRIDGQGGSI